MTTPTADDSPDNAMSKAVKPRGLWSVMQRPVSPPTPDDPAIPRESEAPAEPQTVEHAGTIRGLAEASPSEAERQPDEPTPRGLWSLMASTTELVPSTATEDDLEPFELVDDGEAAITIATDEVAADALGEEFDFQPPDVVITKGRGWQSLLLGIIALPLAATAWFGVLWLSLLTAVCGFGAVILAATEWTATGPVDQRERLKVTVGGVAGVLALLLGPYVFSPLGNASREARTGRNTQRHLQQVGLAVGQYQQTFDAFPIGGTVMRDAEGRARGGHSWMASILPYLGEKPLFDKIDFSQPYDEPVNQPAMRQSVVQFFAAGGNPSLNGGGFAVSHFAGVGGDVKSPRGETQPAGVFRAGKAITPDDITDGLTSTLMAGELSGKYPAWGDPENIRVPGIGLNKDSRGFGNATRTGATMLFADGHVKFFPNVTDPEVLRRLSTRNAGDLTAGVE